jgi:NADPH:quinone reductase-like Zn-dependent oxidoreductase
MERHVFTKRIQVLTEDLFSIDEPWRSRFLELVANEAKGWRWEERPPTREEVATWLNDGELHQKITQILNVWQNVDS